MFVFDYLRRETLDPRDHPVCLDAIIVSRRIRCLIPETIAVRRKTLLMLMVEIVLPWECHASMLAVQNRNHHS